jgi:NAD(P)-dependent dehydrogenase (short-subunit alcohol dehydrogenase family)
MAKTIFITGASSGIGRATAIRFAREGWNVVATMRAVGDGSDLAEMGNVLVTRVDVRDLKSIEGAVAAGVERFGGIDVLVNNAGFGLTGVFETLSREKIAEQFETNVIGVMDVMRAVLPGMRKRKSGVIINVSSRTGVIGLPMVSLYSASKFALEGFSEAISFELASQGIVVKIIEPSGGIAGTQFGERTAKEGAVGNVVEDYEEFAAATSKTFAGLMSAAKTETDDVAAVIWEAATDGTDRLRYFVGVDHPPLMKARREMSEEEYVRFVREIYVGK